MATPADLLRLFAPELNDKAAGDVALALELGALQVAGPAWAVLPDTTRDEAQALYAAWILSAQGVGGVAGSTSTTTGPTAGGVLIMEKEGDLTRQYSTPTGGGTSTSTTAAKSIDGNYRARFDAIAALLGRGAIFTRPTRGGYPWP